MSTIFKSFDGLLSVFIGTLILGLFIIIVLVMLTAKLMHTANDLESCQLLNSTLENNIESWNTPAPTHPIAGQ